MIDLSDVLAVRPLILRMCRNPALRLSFPQIGKPRNRWCPATVQEAASMGLFTDLGAWEFIADCLANGAAIRCLPPTQEFPDYAYEMIESEVDWSRKIYMKLALKPPITHVFGVSFHFAAK